MNLTRKFFRKILYEKLYEKIRIYQGCQHAQPVLCRESFFTCRPLTVKVIIINKEINEH